MIRTLFRRRPRVWLALLGIAGACAGVDKLVGPSMLTPDAPAAVTLPAGTSVVISQVYGGGGNTGATYTNDFIELYNNGTNTVNLAGWSVQYAATGGTSWQVTPLSGTLAPGHYFLIQEAAGTAGTTPLPSPDVIPTSLIAMAGGAGKVALLNTVTPLGGSAAGATPLGGTVCPNNTAVANIVDFVGYGSGTSCFEGTGPTLPTLTNTTSASRKSNGAQDSNNNGNDFTAGAVAPRNSGSAQQGTPVATVSPSTASLNINDQQQFTVAVTLNSQPFAFTAPAWSSNNAAVTIDATSGLATAAAAGNATISVTVQTASGPVTGTATVNVAAVLVPAAPGLVISQIYGGGGNSGATLKNDYIELYNGSTSTVDLTGWSVQYASTTTATWFRTPLSGTVAPGHYFLIQEGAGANGTTALPTPDLLPGVDSISLGATGGKVALVRTTSLLSIQCPATDVSVQDFVGYGTANCSEGGTPTAATSNTTAALRKDSGRQDTNNNGADFTVGAPNPRNAASPRVPPLSELSASIAPAKGAVLVGSTVNFTANAQQFGANVAINSAQWSSSNTAVATIDQASGVATTTGTGTTTITVALVTANGPVSATTQLTASAAPAVVSLTPLQWTLKAGTTKAFVATAVDANNQPTSSTYTWASADPTIATIDQSGVVTGVKNGTTTISATSANNIVGTASVTVVIGNVSLQARVDPLPVGFQTQVFVNGGSTDSHGAPVTGADLTWSTSDANVLTVDPATGVVSAVIAGSAIITGTAADGSAGTTTIVTKVGSFPSSARTGHNTELGLPLGADPLNDTIVARREYTLSYNPAHKTPNWVAWNLDASHKGSQARCNCFTADTAIKGVPLLTTADWINGGIWSRGHMSPSADWANADGDNATTFFLSNMIPQNQTANAGAWGDFEDFLRTQATGNAEIYIVAGPIYTGGVGYGFTTGTGHIAVPDSMWKVAVVVPDARAASGITAPSDVVVYAVNMENSTVSTGSWTGYKTTIDKIQKSTGLDLLAALPEAIQCKLEVRNCIPASVIAGAGLAGGSEGQTLAFNGSSSSDADNDALSYAWQVNGVAAGSGATLNYPFADNGTYTVKLTVDDGKSGIATSSASVVITNVAPAVQTFAGATISEGGTFTNSGSFTDAGDDHWSATVNYGDGSAAQPLTLNADKTFALSHTYANNGSYQVTVTVTETDVEAASGSFAATVTVNNVPPTVQTFAGATILRGETYTSSGTFTDPGADTWNGTVDYGDGSGSSALSITGQSFSLSHVYQTAGVFTAALQVADADGGSANGSATVTVLSPVQGIAVLSDLVDLLGTNSLALRAGTSSTPLTVASSLNAGQRNALKSKLDAASKSLSAGNTIAGQNQLDAFLNQLNAFVQSNQITATAAAPVIAYLSRIQASIGN